MSTQLALITVDEPVVVNEPGEDAEGAEESRTRTAPTAPGAANRVGSRRSPAARAAARRRRSGQIGWLDGRTIETGRHGVASARAALTEASRRAAAREEERTRRRQEDLARLADRTRHPAGRRQAA
jgi:hypothetical protein